MIPIVIAFLTAAGALFLFEQSRENGETLGTALINASLGISFVSSVIMLFFTYMLLQIFGERDNFPIAQPLNNNRGKLLIRLVFWLPYLSFDSLLAAVVTLFVIRGSEYRTSFFCGITFGGLGVVANLCLLSFKIRELLEILRRDGSSILSCLGWILEHFGKPLGKSIWETASAFGRWLCRVCKASTKSTSGCFESVGDWISQTWTAIRRTNGLGEHEDGERAQIALQDLQCWHPQSLSSSWARQAVTRAVSLRT